MRTTLDLPQQLIQEGLKVTRLKTKTELIVTAVSELIRKRKIAKLKDFKGACDLQIDIDKLRGR